MAPSPTAVFSYDRVPYPGNAFPKTHPSHLATVAAMLGLSPPPIETARVLELGCGRGGNLIPMAMTCPGARFVGVDLSNEAITSAKATVAALELGNITFMECDILTLGPDFGQFDYIIAHGVYSWVPDLVRDKVLALMGALISENGVAFVSYNCNPGARLRELSRDLLLHHTAALAEPAEKIAAARNFLAAAAEASDPKSPYGLVLRFQNEWLGEKPDEVVFHDDLEPIARAFTVSEVAGAAARHGLAYLGDACFPYDPLRERHEARKLVEAHCGPSLVAREHYSDFVTGRPFRETLLCRESAPIRPGVLAEAIAGFLLAAPVEPVEPFGDIAARQQAKFAFSNGATITIDHPVFKAALHVLHRTWPMAIGLPALLAEVSRLTGANVDGEERAGLVMALFSLFVAGMLDARLDAPPCVAVAGEKPVGSLYARAQAGAGPQVTNLRHHAVTLDALERDLLCLLDGTRARPALIAELRARGHFEGAEDKSAAATLAKALDRLAKTALLQA